MGPKATCDKCGHEWDIGVLDVHISKSIWDDVDDEIVITCPKCKKEYTIE